MRCSKCGRKMKLYQTQIQSRSGYETDIALRTFRCSDSKCGYTENIKWKILPTYPLFIEKRDGLLIKIR